MTAVQGRRSSRGHAARLDRAGRAAALACLLMLGACGKGGGAPPQQVEVSPVSY
jgi:hypothetical protein